MDDTLISDIFYNVSSNMLTIIFPIINTRSQIICTPLIIHTEKSATL